MKQLYQYILYCLQLFNSFEGNRSEADLTLMGSNVSKSLQKLKLPGRTLLVNVPHEFEKFSKKSKYPNNNTFAKSFESVVCFVSTKKEMNAFVSMLDKITTENSKIWLAYPKSAAKNLECEARSNTGLFGIGQKCFLVGTQISLNEDWTALRFCRAKDIKTIRRTYLSRSKPYKKTKYTDADKAVFYG